MWEIMLFLTYVKNHTPTKEDYFKLSTQLFMLVRPENSPSISVRKIEFHFFLRGGMHSLYYDSREDTTIPRIPLHKWLYEREVPMITMITALKTLNQNKIKWNFTSCNTRSLRLKIKIKFEVLITWCHDTDYCPVAQQVRSYLHRAYETPIILQQS